MTVSSLDIPRPFSAYLAGLRLGPRDWPAAAKAIVTAVVGVTAFILILDGLVFRRSLPAEYVTFYTGPLLPRTVKMCVSAALEEVQFRLVLMTGLVMAMSLVRRPLPPTAFVAAILISQFINVGGLVIAFPLYAALRFWAVGSVWGYLYWRHGWLAALIGHASCHLLLDPLLAFVLIHG